MRVVVMAGSIVPGRSCGIEHFTYGLLNSLTSIPNIELYVIIPKTSKVAWSQRVLNSPNLKFFPLTFSSGISVAIKRSQGERLFSPLKKSKLVRGLFWALRLREEHRLLKSLKPDVVYYPFHRDKVHRKFAYKSVVTVHDLRALQPGLSNPQDAKIVSTNVRIARAVVSSWKHPFIQLCELFPEARGKSFLVPFPPAMRNSSSSKVVSANEPSREDIALYVSITAPHKNHVRLVRAMAKVLQRRSNIRLICVGTKVSPGYEAALEEARRLGIEDRVEFTGFVSDEVLQDLYRKAKMVVAPTLWEAASGTVYEAFSYGKPVACSHIPPLVLQVEQAGAKVRFFNPLDAEDIAQAILEVLDNPDPYIRGSLRGADFLQSLSWEKTAKEYAEIFARVAQIL